MVEVNIVGLLHCGPDMASTTIVSGRVSLDPTVANGYALALFYDCAGAFKSMGFWGDGRSARIV